MEPIMTSQEALLVRKVATTSPCIVTSKYNRIRSDIERRLRHSNNQQSLQVFIRLMRGGHVISDDVNKDNSPNIVAPPTTPIPSLNDGPADDDVTIEDNTSRVTSYSRKQKESPRKTQSKAPIMLNTWVEHNDTWLTMRGRNIRLQHQDHVRNALTGTRATSRTEVKGHRQRSVTPRYPIPSYYGNITNNGSTMTRQRATSTPLVTNGYYSNLMTQQTRRRDTQRCHSSRTTPDSTRSIVIRIPTSAKTTT
ncbi:uncharacterized protein LOC100176172 [Ciona intestinalis]